MVAIAEQNVNVISLDNMKAKLKWGRWEKKNRKKRQRKGLKKKKKAQYFHLRSKSSQLTKGKEPEKELLIYFLRLWKELKVKLKIMMQLSKFRRRRWGWAVNGSNPHLLQYLVSRNCLRSLNQETMDDKFYSDKYQKYFCNDEKTCWWKWAWVSEG